MMAHQSMNACIIRHKGPSSKPLSIPAGGFFTSNEVGLQVSTHSQFLCLSKQIKNTKNEY